MDLLRQRSGSRSALGTSRMSESGYDEAGAYNQVKDIINIQIEEDAQENGIVFVVANSFRNQASLSRSYFST